MFWLAHGLVVFVLGAVILTVEPGTASMTVVASALLDPALWLAGIALLAGHLADFWLNFFDKREYVNVTARQQQNEPYPRMLVLHVTIIIGGFAVGIIYEPAAMIAALVVLKTILDLALHFAARAKLHAPAGGTGRA